MKTKDKIFFANIARHAVLSLRKCAGRGSLVRCHRMGLNWDLDLDEGIDFAIYLLGAHERATIATYRRVVRLGGTVLDIGANIGSHTLPLADIVGSEGRVVAVEPTKFAIDKLRRNLDLNPKLGPVITPTQAMLSDDSGNDLPETLPSSWPLDQKGDIHPEMRSKEQSTVGAEVLKADDLVARYGLEKVDFIKLDVDGYEVAVLRGARDILSEFKPRIVMELAEYTLKQRGYEMAELLELLAHHGYQFHDERIQRRLPNTYDGLRPYMETGASTNTVLLPPGDPLALELS